MFLLVFHSSSWFHYLKFLKVFSFWHMAGTTGVSNPFRSPSFCLSVSVLAQQCALTVGLFHSRHFSLFLMVLSTLIGIEAYKSTHMMNLLGFPFQDLMGDVKSSF